MRGRAALRVIDPDVLVALLICRHFYLTTIRRQGAASPNFAILETIQSAPWRDIVQKEPRQFTNGYLELPTTSGLGVDLDEEVIAGRPYDPLRAEEALLP